MKVKVFYIEDLALEQALQMTPDEIRPIISEGAWRKMGFVCDDGASFLTFNTFSGLKNIIITETGSDRLKTEKIFRKYLKKNFMKPIVLDNELVIED